MLKPNVLNSMYQIISSHCSQPNEIVLRSQIVPDNAMVSTNITVLIFFLIKEIFIENGKVQLGEDIMLQDCLVSFSRLELATSWRQS